jgi:hypothetical protein
VTTTTPLALLASLLLGTAAGAQVPAPPPASGPPAAPAAVAAAQDPAALAIVKRMSDRLKAARTFTAKGRTSLEGAVAGGLLATSFSDFETTVRRPDGLAVRRSGDLPEFRFAYDGKAMTILVPGKKMWATTDAPATLDAMLVAAGEKGDVDVPFDELLVADPWAAITAGLTDAVRAGPATIRGKKVDHVVLASAALRLEYWIDPGTALPVRSLVVYVDHPLQPHFLVEFSDWKLDQKLPDSTFALPRPAGATQVDFREAAGTYR